MQRRSEFKKKQIEQNEKEQREKTKLGLIENLKFEKNKKRSKEKKKKSKIKLMRKLNQKGAMKNPNNENSKRFAFLQIKN